MKNFYPCLLFILLFSNSSHAQNQVNNWYFGSTAAITFNGGTVAAIGTSKLTTQEGCSGYSDPLTGQLLFYTDGDSIWNKNNIPMPNGFGLGGHNSSTQSALVIPRPGSTTQFYLFTLGAWAGLQPGLSPGNFNLNLIDMTLNGGLGDVIIKNQLILNTVCEKLTATLHCNGTDYWVVIHDWDSKDFYAYLLTSAGLSAAPVISSVGTKHQDLGGGLGYEAIGYMKISPDGKKLALTCYTDFTIMELFDFNNSNGSISNMIKDSTFFAYTGNSGLYGLAFSPDNSKLYLSSLDGISSPGNVYQYDLSSGVAATIISSKTIIHSSANEIFGALQLAPNGKIYLAKSSSGKLDVINNPNSLGAACGYVANGLQMGNALGQHTSQIGLPNFVEIFNTPTPFTLTYNGCGGQYTAVLLDTVIPLPVSVVWNFGDPASGVNNTSNLLSPSHSFTTIGNYTITLNITAGCTNFVWTTQLDLTDSFQVDYGPDLSVCAGDSIQLNNAFPYGMNYQWTPASGLSCTNCASPMAMPATSTTYTITIDDGPGCHAEDTFAINILSSVTAIISPDTSICPGGTVQLVASGGTSYLWFNEPSLSSFSIPNPTASPFIPTVYSVIVSIPGCVPDTASVFVDIYNLPDVDAGPDLTILLENSAIINATSNGVSYLWQPGSGLNDSTILTPLASPTVTTTYTITVDNGYGCISVDSVIVFVNDGTVPILFFPNAFSPNGDGVNDLFDYFNFGYDKVWMRIYNRWGEVVYETELPHDGWDGNRDDAPCSIGVYVYTAVAIDKGKSFYYKGNFTLIR